MQTSSFSEPLDAVRAAHHQIGNSLRSLQGREAEPQTATALFEVSRRVCVIMRLNQRLQTSGDDTVCLDGSLADVARDVAAIAETPRKVMLRLDLDPMEASSQTASALALIAAELVGNAFQHVFVQGGGEVRVGTLTTIRVAGPTPDEVFS